MLISDSFSVGDIIQSCASGAAYHMLILVLPAVSQHGNFNLTSFTRHYVESRQLSA